MIPFDFIGKIADAGSKITESIAGNISALIKRKEGILAKDIDLQEVKATIEKNVSDELTQLTKIAQEREEAILKDIADARGANVKIQETEKASWMAKNVAYVIDLFLMTIWGAVTIYILARMLNFIAKDDHVDFTGVLAMWGGITALATTVVNFHRGSSKGSQDKDKQISEMMNK